MRKTQIANSIIVILNNTENRGIDMHACMQVSKKVSAHDAIANPIFKLQICQQTQKQAIIEFHSIHMHTYLHATILFSKKNQTALPFSINQWIKSYFVFFMRTPIIALSDVTVIFDSNL